VALAHVVASGQENLHAVAPANWLCS